MQIKVNLQIFIFIIIFLLTNQILLYAILMLFAFIHEIGHLLAGLILKLKPNLIRITPFGLSITFEGYGEKVHNNINKKRLLIALAGPLTNIILVIIFMLIPDWNFIVSKEILVYSNLLIAMFNLMPIYPLDGGRILENVLKYKMNNIKSVEITNKVSNLLAIIITILASIFVFYIKNIAVFFVILYLWYLIVKENERFRLLKKAYNVIENKYNMCWKLIKLIVN